MLNYNTCQQLKNAGFPQLHELSRDYYTVDGHVAGGWQFDKVEDGFILSPNLGDLIEACGEKFMSLEKATHPLRLMWQAKSRIEFVSLGEGNTPEEAVAFLLLSLLANNEKPHEEKS